MGRRVHDRKSWQYMTGVRYVRHEFALIQLKQLLGQFSILQMSEMRIEWGYIKTIGEE